MYHVTNTYRTTLSPEPEHDGQHSDEGSDHPNVPEQWIYVVVSLLQKFHKEIQGPHVFFFTY